jgi:hypothetical protein
MLVSIVEIINKVEIWESLHIYSALRGPLRLLRALCVAKNAKDRRERKVRACLTCSHS